MNATDLQLVFVGAILFGLVFATLYFVRFWRKTQDRLFAWFAAAFFVLACERVLLLWSRTMSEVHPAIYLIRLCAFLLIIAALVDKNRQRKR